MSQHTWTTHDGWDCLTGWDPPLACFFLSISRTCDICGGSGLPQPGNKDTAMCQTCRGSGEEWLYNNLDHGNGAMTLVEVETTLKELLDAYPTEIPLRLAADRQGNVSNVVTSYDTIGYARGDE